MEVKVSILGVCCSCQSAHPVYRNPKPEECADSLTGEVDKESYYLMAYHRFNGDYGPECEGEGTVPQVIITEG